MIKPDNLNTQDIYNSNMIKSGRITFTYSFKDAILIIMAMPLGIILGIIIGYLIGNFIL